MTLTSSFCTLLSIHRRTYKILWNIINMYQEFFHYH